jgi:hypothetical protein
MIDGNYSHVQPRHYTNHQTDEVKIMKQMIMGDELHLDEFNIKRKEHKKNSIATLPMST